MSRELSPKLTATFSDPDRCAQHAPRRFSPRPAYASKITHVELPPPASEAFKWILRWRGQNQRLALSKLRKMKPLLSAPIAAEADAQAHRASAGLCLAACCLWHTDEAAELAPAQVSALRAETEAWVAKLDLQGDLHQFELYFRFLETLLSDLSVPQLMLTVLPLENLLDTGRVKSSGSGLWLSSG